MAQLMSPRQQQRLLPDELVEAPTTGLYLQEAEQRVLALYRERSCQCRGYASAPPERCPECTDRIALRGYAGEPGKPNWDETSVELLQALRLTVAKVAARLFEAETRGNVAIEERGERRTEYFSETAAEVTFKDTALLRPFDDSEPLYGLP